MSTRWAIYSSNAFRETFTKAHRDLLGPTYVLTGSPRPDTVNGHPIIGPGLVGTLRRRSMQWIGKVPVVDIPFEVFLRNEKPAFVFAEFGTAGADLVAACERHGVGLFASFYGLDAFEHVVLERYKDRYRHLFRYATKVLVQSRSIERQLVGMGCPPEKLVRNPCSPDLSFAGITPKKGSRTLAAIGRFVDKKSPVSVIMAFRTVHQQHPDARLEWAGDGPLMPAARELVGALGLSEAILFRGRIDPAEQARILGRSAMLIQHSVTAENGDQEGIPVVIMEAMLAGLPVVSTVHSGIPEVVEHGASGLLVAEHDIMGMGAAITTLLEDPAKAEAMGQHGRDFILANYTLDKHIAGMRAMLGL
jgi:glycosyltransferase involved in cell wall biosynthesis